MLLVGITLCFFKAVLHCQKLGQLTRLYYTLHCFAHCVHAASLAVAQQRRLHSTLLHWATPPVLLPALLLQ
jgi:hypothetical protein